MTNTEEKRFKAIFDRLVNICHTNASMYHEEVINITGSSLNYKTHTGRMGMYITKSGKAKKAFYCPAKFNGCGFSADKATSVKRHLLNKQNECGCQHIINAQEEEKVPHRVKKPINDIQFDCNSDEFIESITILSEKMGRIGRQQENQYDGVGTSWLVVEENGRRHTHYGSKASCILLLVEWFKNTFMPNSGTWGPTALMKRYKNGSGCRFMDKDIHFYYYDEEWVKLKRDEALRFLVGQFKDIFIKAYEEGNNDWIGDHARYYWHEILFGFKHKHEIRQAEDYYFQDIELECLPDVERRFYESRNGRNYLTVKN